MAYAGFLGSSIVPLIYWYKKVQNANLYVVTYCHYNGNYRVCYLFKNVLIKPLIDRWMNLNVRFWQPASGGMFWSTDVIDCGGKLPPHCFWLRPDNTCFSNWTCYLWEGWGLHAYLCVRLPVCAYNKSWKKQHTQKYILSKMCFYMIWRKVLGQQDKQEDSFSFL